jgi:hypothetical protein
LVAFLFSIRTYSQEFTPILITGLVHIDPITADMTDETQILKIYNESRDALIWYINFAEQNGIKLSAQMSGAYAELCLGNIHASDFRSFMPGGLNHLGTHLHAETKQSGKYLWKKIPTDKYADEATITQALRDHISQVNSIFTANSSSSDNNWLMHGNKIGYPGMDALLMGGLGNGITNKFSMSEGKRGFYMGYRSGYFLEPWENWDTTFTRFSQVGGEIGFDSDIDGSGKTYGTFQYQKRDFLRVYIEWREAVRRNEHTAIYHFNWLTHPYQLMPNLKGSDGKLVRQQITDLVNWLYKFYINKSDETGKTIARSANASEIKSAIDNWRVDYPEQEGNLQGTIGNGEMPLYSPGIYRRLESCFHYSEVETTDPMFVAHRFLDRNTMKTVYLAWTKQGSKSFDKLLPIKGDFIIVNGDSSIIPCPEGTGISINEIPVLVEPVDPVGVNEQADSRVSIDVTPNPANDFASIRIFMPKEELSTIKLFDITGNTIAVIADNKQISSGFYSVDLRNISSGVYYVALQTKSGTMVSKLIVQK